MNADSLEVVDFVPGDEGVVAIPPEDESRRRIAGSCALVLAVVVLCDAVIYRGHGFAGYAVLFAALPLVMAVQSIRTPRRRSGALIVIWDSSPQRWRGAGAG